MNTQNTLYEILCKEEFLYESWKAIRSKKAAGGIDGVTLACFEDNVQKYITELADELRNGTWAPEPYLGIEIPKKKKEVRKLGLLSVKDKIVQYSIKTLVEPFFENTFVDKSRLKKILSFTTLSVWIVIARLCTSRIKNASSRKYWSYKCKDIYLRKTHFYYLLDYELFNHFTVF